MPARIPSPRIEFAWMILAGWVVAWLWQLVDFWGLAPDYTDRFLIVIGTGWAAHRLTQVGPMDTSPSRPLLGGVSLLSGAVLFAFSWSLPSNQVGLLSIRLWFMTFSLMLASLGLLLGRGGRSIARHYAFPLIFPFFALKLPTLIMAVLQNGLQQLTTSTAYEVLTRLGYTVTRQGFTLQMPGGDLGVAEACSGVRSLTALTAIAAFMAHVRHLSAWRGMILVLLSIPVVAVINILRVVLSGVIQEQAGERFIQGTWHDALGLLTVLVGLALIVEMSRWWTQKAKPTGTMPVVPILTTRGPIPWIERGTLALALFAGVLLHLQIRPKQESTIPEPRLGEIPLQIESWTGSDLEVPSHVRELYSTDLILHRSYRNNFGLVVDTWVIVCMQPKMIKGYHHPDHCLPGRGMEVNLRWKQDVVIGSDRIPCTARTLSRGADRLLAYYWTQQGREVWSDKDEAAAEKESGGISRLISLYRDGSGQGIADAASPRLIVLVGTNKTDSLAQSEVFRFVGLFGAEVHRLCPWAANPLVRE